jgi:ElaB/YqjD/DUF883 family membrane-anchored ribosome-binding protein
MTAEATATKPAKRRANATKAAAELESGIARLRDEIAGLRQTVTNYGAAKAGQYRDGAAHAAESVSSHALETMEAARVGLARLEGRFSGKVRSNPLQALGIAVAAGFLAALVMRR